MIFYKQRNCGGLKVIRKYVVTEQLLLAMNDERITLLRAEVEGFTSTRFVARVLPSSLDFVPARTADDELLPVS